MIVYLLSDFDVACKIVGGGASAVTVSADG
jgi:hypothetical protein